MCGLIHAIDTNGAPIANVIYNQYTEQQSRGRQGFGWVSIDKDGIATRSRYANEILAFFNLGKEDASEIAFHHRYPTSTKNTASQAHPFYIEQKEYEFAYFFMHNGVISNAEELLKEHQSHGLQYETLLEDDKGVVSFNDSEALAHDFIRHIEGKQSKLKAMGSIAFFCYQVEKGTKKVVKRFMFKGSNPLTFAIADGIHLTASEVESGKAKKENRLYCYDYAEKKQTTVKLKFPERVYKPYRQQTLVGWNDWDDGYEQWGVHQHTKDKSRYGVTQNGLRGWIDESNVFHPYPHQTSYTPQKTIHLPAVSEPIGFKTSPDEYSDKMLELAELVNKQPEYKPAGKTVAYKVLETIAEIARRQLHKMEYAAAMIKRLQCLSNYFVEIGDVNGQIGTETALDDILEHTEGVRHQLTMSR